MELFRTEPPTLAENNSYRIWRMLKAGKFNRFEVLHLNLDTLKIAEQHFTTCVLRMHETMALQ